MPAHPYAEPLRLILGLRLFVHPPLHFPPAALGQLPHDAAAPPNPDEDVSSLYPPPTPKQIELVFSECVTNVLDGDWTLAREDTLRLAALFLQIECGDFDWKTHTVSYFTPERLAELLPPPLRAQNLGLEEQIIKEYKKLMGTPREVAMARYIDFVAKCDGYGTHASSVASFTLTSPLP